MIYDIYYMSSKYFNKGTDLVSHFVSNHDIIFNFFCEHDSNYHYCIKKDKYFNKSEVFVLMIMYVCKWYDDLKGNNIV